MLNKVISKLCTVLLFVIIFSCKEELKEKIEYYPNGKIHRKHTINSKGEIEGQSFQYNEDGTIDRIFLIKNNKLSDSIVCFENNVISKIISFTNKDTLEKNFKNGVLESEGYFLNGKNIGNWTYYKNKKKHKVIQFIDLCGTQYTNQGWAYNDKGELIAKGSNYYEILDKKEHYKKDEEFIFFVKYQSLWGAESMSHYAISTELDKNFCNFKEVKIDSFTTNKHLLRFRHKFSESGKKHIRGYIREFGYIEEAKDSFIFKQRKVYFDIPVIIE